MPSTETRAFRQRSLPWETRLQATGLRNDPPQQTGGPESHKHDGSQIRSKTLTIFLAGMRIGDVHDAFLRATALVTKIPSSFSLLDRACKRSNLVITQRPKTKDEIV
jgi:hypothetical protein